MKTKINKRQLGAILRESIYAPNKPGPLKVIIDVGDSRYYRQRALELVTLSLESPTEDQCIYYLEQAITLLAVAKHVIRTDPDPDPDPDIKPVFLNLKDIKTKSIENAMKLANDPH